MSTHQKSKGSCLGCLFGLVGVAIASASMGALLAFSIISNSSLPNSLKPEDAAAFNQDTPLITERIGIPALTRPVNILVLGTKVLTTDLSSPPAGTENLKYQALVDSFEGLTDTMLLVRLNPDTQAITILSIPRDTRIEMDGYNFHKINAANAYGGPALSAIAVRELLGGVPIDRYLRVNVQGVEQFVDALGGVTINVPFDMKYQDDSQHLYIDLKAGKQHLNGSQVQQYLRFRHDAQGDIGRVQRQQQLMRAILEQALTPTTIPRLPKLFSVIQHHIDTNLTSKELMALAGFSATTQRSQVGMVMLPGRFSQPEEFDASYWVPNLDEIDTLMAQYFTNNDPAISAAREPEKLMIAIQDGSGHDRNIEPLVEQLGYLGYTNTFIDHSTSEPPQTTQIIAQRGDRASAQALQEALGFGEVRVDSTGNLSSDLTLQVGKDWP